MYVGRGGDDEKRKHIVSEFRSEQAENMRTRGIRTRLVCAGHDFVIGNLVCAEDHGGLVGVLIRLV